MSLNRCILRSIFVSLLMLVAAMPVAFANSPDFMAKVLNVRDGMTQNGITDVFRDSRGYVWIGTRYGLNRYDTYSITRYYSDETDNSIGGNGVYKIFEDQDGLIWILSTTEAAVYDHATDRFRKVTADGEPVAGRSVWFLDDGFIMAGKGNLYRYTSSDDSLRLIPVTGGSNQEYFSIYPWENDTYLLHARRDGLWIYDPATATISRFEEIPITNITVVRMDDEGNLWVAPYNSGVVRYDRKGNKLKQFSTAEGLSNDMVIDIHIDGQEVMIGTEKGLDIIDRATDKLHPSARSRYAKRFGSINRIYHDRYGNQYLGTVRNGIIIIQSTTMRTFPLAPPGEIENTVTSFVRGKDGNLLGGIDGYGVVTFDPETYETRTIDATYGMKVVNLVEWPGDKVLVSDWGSPLKLLDKHTEKFCPLPSFLDSMSVDAINNRLGIHFLPLPSGRMAAITDNITIIDPEKRITTPIVEYPEHTPGHLKRLFYNDSIVMTIRAHRVMVADLKTGVMTQLTTSPDGSIIECGQYDGRDTIYLATLERLYAYSISADKFEEIDSDFLHNIKLMYYDNGRLWIGANSKLYLYDKGRFVSFDEGNGVEMCEMRPTSILEDSTRIYFGGTLGVVSIDKQATDSLVALRPSEAPIYISDVIVNNASVINDIRNGAITVPASHTSVTVKLMVSESSPFRSKLYRYYFNGSNLPSPIESDCPYITVNDLPSGTAVHLEVAYTLTDGSWSRPVEILQINVRQLWWKSWWFIMILVALAIGALYVALRMLKQRWKSDSDRQRRHMLERDIEILANINQGLRSPIDKIAAPINEALSQIDDKGEIDRKALAGSLRNALEQVDLMHDMVDSPFEMLHPRNLTLTSMNLTARFNTWLVEQLNAFVRAHRIDNKIDFTFIPDCDRGTITFNASRLEIVINSLLTDLVEAGYRHLRIGISDDRSNNLLISFTYEGGSLPEVDAIPHESESLRLVYARWIAELDDDRLATLIGDDGKLIGAILVVPAVKSQRTAPQKETHHEEIGEGVVREYVTTSSDLSDLTVFALEADKSSGDYLRSCTEGAFRHVTINDNAENAYSHIEEYMPDIVILDTASDPDGSIELCRRIKSNEELATIPVIMLTSGDLSKIKEASFRYGADAYLEKPYDRSVLIDLCHTLIVSA